MVAQSVLEKKSWRCSCEEDCSTTSVGKDPDQSRMDHCWRASTLESYRDYSVTRSSSSESITSVLVHAYFDLIEIYKVILGFAFRLASFNC